MPLHSDERLPNLGIRERSIDPGRCYLAVFSQSDNNFRSIFSEHSMNVTRIVVLGDDDQAPCALADSRHVFIIPSTLGFFKSPPPRFFPF
jgi:hypothetical protein